MKKLVTILGSLIVAVMGGPAQADDPPRVPHLMNLQSLIYDADGNLTTSESADLTIRIVDENNNVLYTENHPGVPVIGGAVNVSVGSNESFGTDFLDPTGGHKFLDLSVGGENPFELMPLVAVPYAIWAEKALTIADDAIESRHIKDGTIQIEDLDPITFGDIQGQAAEGQLPSGIATDAELSAHVNAVTAHSASAISVTGPFALFVADDLQEFASKTHDKLMDEIVNRQDGQKKLTTDVTNLQNVTSDINNIPGTLSGAKVDSINNVPGILGESKIDGAITRDNEVVGIADPSFTTNAEAASIADSRISNAISSNVIPDSPSDIGAAPASHNHDGDYVNVGGDTMSGPLDMGGNSITNVGTGSGIGSTVASYESRITALEGDPVSSKVSKSGDTMTGDLTLSNANLIVDSTESNKFTGKQIVLRAAGSPVFRLNSLGETSTTSLVVGNGTGSTSYPSMEIATNYPGEMQMVLRANIGSSFHPAFSILGVPNSDTAYYMSLGNTDGVCCSAKFKVRGDGAVFADNGYNSNADFAELMVFEGERDNYPGGTVLVISEDQPRSVKPSSRAYEKNVIGVASPQPGFLGRPAGYRGRGDPDTDSSLIAVAFTGIVSTKVSASGGEILPGDLLTTSEEPGVGMKATIDTFDKIGSVFGKALDDCREGTCLIEVAIGIR